jgi:nicotinamide-nucleotide amidase
MKPEEALLQTLRRTGLTVDCAESCTGGLICKRLTDLPGASAHVLGGAVTYTNEMKKRFLGVGPETLETYTAVSEQTALEMAAGICRVTGADLGLAVTGYAGPDSSPEAPAGLIWIGVCLGERCFAKRLPRHHGPDRAKNRESAADYAMALGLETIKENEDGTF